MPILSSVTLSNIIPSNNLLLNSNFKNPTDRLRILYVFFNMNVNFYANLLFDQKLIFYVLF